MVSCISSVTWKSIYLGLDSTNTLLAERIPTKTNETKPKTNPVSSTSYIDKT